MGSPHTQAECQRSGIKMDAKDLVEDGHVPGLLVHPAWREPKHPQERPYRPRYEEGRRQRINPEGPNADAINLWNVDIFGQRVLDAGLFEFLSDNPTLMVGSQVSFVAANCNQALGNAGTINVSVGAGPLVDDLVLLVLHAPFGVSLQTEPAGFTRVYNRLANLDTTRGNQADLPHYICFKKLTSAETNWTHTIVGGTANDRWQLCAYVMRGQDLTRPIGNVSVTSQDVPFRNTSIALNNLEENYSVVGGGHLRLGDASNAIMCGGGFSVDDSAATFTGFPGNILASGQIPNMRVDTIINPSTATRRLITWNGLVTGLSLPGRTNLLGRSQDEFTNAFFTRSGITSMVDLNAGNDGVYGNIIETTIRWSTANTQHYLEFPISGLTIGQTYTFGCRSQPLGTGGGAGGMALTVNDGSERGSHFGGVSSFGRVATAIGTGATAYCDHFNTAYNGEAESTYISFVAAATSATFRIYRTNGSVLSNTLPAGTLTALYWAMVAVGRVSGNGGYVKTSGGVAVTSPSGIGYAPPVVVHSNPAVSTFTNGIATNVRSWALEIRAAGTTVGPMKMANQAAVALSCTVSANELSYTGTNISGGAAFNSAVGLAEGLGNSRHHWDTNKKLYWEVKVDSMQAGTAFYAGLSEAFNPGIFGAPGIYYWGSGDIEGFAYRKDGTTKIYGVNEGVVAATYTTNDIIGCSVDWVAREVKWYKNGVLQRTHAMPAGDRAYIPRVGSGDVSGGVTFRLHTYTMNFSGSFGGRLPSGFKAWDYDNEVP